MSVNKLVFGSNEDMHELADKSARVTFGLRGFVWRGASASVSEQRARGIGIRARMWLISTSLN